MLSGVELCRSARFNSALVAFGLDHTEKWPEGIHLFLTTTFEADSAPSRTLEVDFSRRSSFHLQLAVFTTQERKQGLVRHLCDEAVSVLQSSVIWLFWCDCWRMDWPCCPEATFTCYSSELQATYPFRVGTPLRAHANLIAEQQVSRDAASGDS
jgi:hypothetical protein